MQWLGYGSKKSGRWEIYNLELVREDQCVPEEVGKCESATLWRSLIRYFSAGVANPLKACQPILILLSQIHPTP